MNRDITVKLTSQEFDTLFDVVNFARAHAKDDLLEKIEKGAYAEVVPAASWLLSVLALEDVIRGEGTEGVEIGPWEAKER